MATGTYIHPSYLDGRYHRKFNRDPLVEKALSRKRALKLQRWVKPSDSIFEYGVGTALNLRELKCEIRVGYDPSCISRNACEEAGLEFVESMQSLGNRQFDIVLCHHVLEHVINPSEVLYELKELLKPTGKLILIVPYEFNRRYQCWKPDDPNRHLYSWNVMTLSNLISELGFEVEKTSVEAYGYQQRLAPLSRFGDWLYNLSVTVANHLRPCIEIQLIARPQISLS